jgi:hypothetical protein
MNPWGEQMVYKDSEPDQWSSRLLLACEMYHRQQIRFDGYIGSTGDGVRYMAAIDRMDGTWIPDLQKGEWEIFHNGIVDDLTERLWMSADFPVHALSLAGFPIRWAMKAHLQELQGEGTTGRYPKASDPDNMSLYRQVGNLQYYFEKKQFYSRDLIGRERVLDRNYRPPNPFEPGDLLFLGVYDGQNNAGFDRVRHCAIVVTLDQRGLPDEIYNMRVPRLMHERLCSQINLVREIEGQQVRFQHFYDRYAIIGHGRVTNWFTAPAEANVKVDMPEEQPTGLDTLGRELARHTTTTPGRSSRSHYQPTNPMQRGFFGGSGYQPYPQQGAGDSENQRVNPPPGMNPWGSSRYYRRR